MKLVVLNPGASQCQQKFHRRLEFKQKQQGLFAEVVVSENKHFQGCSRAMNSMKVNVN